jgi:hypothetical protein
VAVVMIDDVAKKLSSLTEERERAWDGRDQRKVVLGAKDATRSFVSSVSLCLPDVERRGEPHLKSAENDLRLGQLQQLQARTLRPVRVRFAFDPDCCPT